MPRGQGPKRPPSYLPSPLDILIGCREIQEQRRQVEGTKAAGRKNLKPKDSDDYWTPPIVDTDGMSALEERFFRDDGDFEGGST